MLSAFGFGWSALSGVFCLSVRASSLHTSQTRLRKHRVISLIHTILEEAKVKVSQDPELVAALVDAI